jgi:hypothetical protein
MDVTPFSDRTRPGVVSQYGSAARVGGHPAADARRVAAVLAVLLAASLLLPAPLAAQTPIGCGETQQATLAAGGDTDVYQFDAAAGEVVAITVGVGAGNFNPCWELFNRNGVAVGAQVCESQALRTLPAGGGPFTIGVSDDDNAEGGDYALSLQPVSATFDGMPSCAPPIGCGETRQGTLVAGGDTDAYQFDAAAGDVVAITVGTGAGNFTPCWELFNRNGEAVGTRVCESQALRTLPASGGPCTIKVSDDDYAEGGDYTLSLEPVSATFDGAPSCAPLIGCGQTRQATLVAGGDTDAYQFSAAAGEVVAITVGVGLGNFIPCWELFNRNGGAVGGRVCQSQALRTMPASGGGTIKVSDDNYAEGGTYTLSLPRVSATLCAATAVDLGTGVGQPGGIACVPATLTSGPAQVAATTNQVGFDPTQFSLNSCTINPTIGVGSTANKVLSAMSPGLGAQRVQIGGNTNLIPDGLLDTCEFMVGAGATLGAHVLTNTPGATDPDGNPISDVGGTAGQITVTTCTGDCDGNGRVSIGEVIKCLNMFLGQPLCNTANPNLNCPVADANLNGSISIGEVTQCVTHFLNGCL